VQSFHEDGDLLAFAHTSASSEINLPKLVRKYVAHGLLHDVNHVHGILCRDGFPKLGLTRVRRMMTRSRLEPCMIQFRDHTFARASARRIMDSSCLVVIGVQSAF